MDTKTIQNELAKLYITKNHNPVCTNFVGCGYAECDVLTISNSDYVYEFEVKISKADFKKDKEKVIKHRYLNDAYISKIQKKRKTKKVNRIPNYFSYVCPTNLIKLEDVPIYAGLVYVDDNYTFTVIRKPSILHKDLADIKLLKRVARTLTERVIFGSAYKTFLKKSK